MNKLLLLVDGHSLAFRSYWAFNRGNDGGLRTKSGIPTSVTYGFLKALFEVLAKENFVGCAVAFDHHLPTFRHEVDETYKAGRPETPAEFISDLENLKGILTAMQVPTIELLGFEADDILGTLACAGLREGHQVKILTGDQDLFQLVDPDRQITVLQPNSKQGMILEFGTQEIKDKLGVWPNQIVDYKALCGDSSDNIPGVKGIGAKTAVKLLEDYPNLAAIYEHIDEIKGAVQKKLIEGKKEADHSYWMATLRTNVPLAVTLQDCYWRNFDLDAVKTMLNQLEFRTLTRQVEQFARGGQLETSGPPLPRELVMESEDLWFDFKPTVRSTHQVVIVDTLTAFQDFLTALREHPGPVAWDTETTSLDPHEARLVGIGCAWSADTAYYLPLGHREGTCLDLGIVLAALAPEFADPKRPKIFQNTKYDRLILRQQGLELRGVVFDPMLASYDLQPEGQHKLDVIALNLLGVEMTPYEQLVPRGKTIDELPITKVANYCAMDALCAYRVTNILQSRLANNPKLLHIFHTLELPLEEVLADMEWVGIRIDSDYLAKLSQELQLDLERLEQQVHAAAGMTFNLNSPKQLSEILFDRLGLSTRKTRKTTLGWSTDAATLEKLQGDHPLVDGILEHRTLAKLRSTYVEALPNLVSPKTGRVHTDFNQAVTVTGRLSSSNPNLQNIPIRTELSKRIRQAFIPDVDCCLVSADYSQIELRILAHVSGEQILIDTFRNKGDVHTLTAQLLFNREDITREQRYLGKTINFGVVYGMGAQRFARETGVTSQEAQKFLESFYERYPKVFAYLRGTEKLALEQGYVETLLGRRRHFPGLNQLPTNQRLTALRQATNAPIQGTAADIIKQAMITLHQELKPYQTRMVLQVHDELVFEVPQAEWPLVETVIRTAMENAYPLQVPLFADIHCGPSWLEAK
ncbi:DNA polymerase I [Candidatus Cyanaurora vandensis]|uniref:DNA polymerase I n=1 Tax=Candidatus Cyanaurora vandensis TaxID=2714958 RepID=UPI00257B5E59|nr:DNA polymerase I [Candidatus Cyanaurora vandensis]